MNNKNILDELQSNGNSLMPSDRLDPATIESSLSGVKRKSYKGIKTACVSLAVVCITAIGVGVSSSRYTLPVKTENTNVSSYNEIYKIVHSIKKANEESFLDKLSNNFTFGKVYYDSVQIQDFVTNDVSDTKTYGVSESATPEYSETNIQVKGVDEADIVKTDGKYIYSVNSKIIYISQANNGNPLKVSEIVCEKPVLDIYIHENKLVVFTRSYIDNENDDKKTNAKGFISDVEGGCYEHSYSLPTATKVCIYDLSDIKKPVQVSELIQSGSYLSTRKIDNVVYITTNYGIYDYEAINKRRPETYCPVYGEENSFSCVEAENIYVAETVEDIEYVVVSSIDLNNPKDFSDICSVMGSGSEVYSSVDNLYVASYCYSEDNSDSTEIMRFSLNGTDIAENGSLKADGNLLNQFSMDEYNGFFRVVTENFNFGTTLYVFDSELKLVGKSEGVASDENVKSVRFDGDVAYFVTFRQTDPLFTVDLSDPTSPKILSELKIPGFSEYLHPFGDGLLLGFGVEADPDTGIPNGLKLTMFDTSDKTNVTEITTRIFADNSSNSAAEFDHKAIFIDEEKGIIGIPYSNYEYGADSNNSYYAFFKYDTATKEFVLCNDILLSSGRTYNSSSSYKYNYINAKGSNYARGLYIGDYFYIVEPNIISVINYNTFELKSELNLEKSTVIDRSSVIELPTELSTEPITEPYTEPSTEPITEPYTELITEPSTEPSTEPTTEAITESSTVQN